MSDAATAALPPSPAASPEAASEFGPTLTCPGCKARVLAGTVECPSCRRSTRTGAALVLAILAAVSGIAAVFVYGAEIFTTSGTPLRQTFYALTGLAAVVGAWSVFQGRRAGWIGLQTIW